MTFTRIEIKNPRIAIVGRPNVGKSTLFNRFLGKRRAITDPTPGVTRDPVETVCALAGRTVSLVDTGGFKLGVEGLEEIVTQRSLDVIGDADLVVLLLDVNELTPEDEIFIDHLRPFSDKVIVAVNKVDNPEREAGVWNYSALGFGDVIGISAAHGRNIDALKVKIASRLDAAPVREIGEEEVPDVKVLSIAILGKPNTGKSTLNNLLVGRELSIVSAVPGTTRDVIEGAFDYRGRAFRILDTAGIRRKSRVGEDIEYYSVNRAIKSIDEADVVLLMVDVEEGLTDQDKKIAGLIVKRGKGVVIVLSKWDKMPPVANRFEAASDRVKFLFPVLDFAPIVPISALKKTGIDKLLDVIVMVDRELHYRVDTGRFNRFLQKWLEEYPPPTVQRKRYKIRYGTQASTHPVKFILFVNRLHGFPDGYVQYLKNRIRKNIGFHHIPIDIELRESERGDAPFLDR